VTLQYVMIPTASVVNGRSGEVSRWNGVVLKPLPIDLNTTPCHLLAGSISDFIACIHAETPLPRFLKKMNVRERIQMNLNLVSTS
jgi:hypothetical protein